MKSRTSRFSLWARLMWLLRLAEASWRNRSAITSLKLFLHALLLIYLALIVAVSNSRSDFLLRNWPRARSFASFGFFVESCFRTAFVIIICFDRKLPLYRGNNATLRRKFLLDQEQVVLRQAVSHSLVRAISGSTFLRNRAILSRLWVTVTTCRCTRLLWRDQFCVFLLCAFQARDTFAVLIAD